MVVFFVMSRNTIEFNKEKKHFERKKNAMFLDSSVKMKAIKKMVQTYFKFIHFFLLPTILFKIFSLFCFYKITLNLNQKKLVPQSEARNAIASFIIKGDIDTKFNSQFIPDGQKKVLVKNQ